jgi:hypothetical protein
LDATVIIVVLISIPFIVGGLIAGHYRNKATKKIEEEIKNNIKDRYNSQGYGIFTNSIMP